MLQITKHLSLVTVFSCIVAIYSLPTSLVEEVKDNHVRNVKVKRAQDPSSRLEKAPRDGVPIYGNPTAIKRGSTNFNDQYGQWDNEGIFQNVEIPPSLFVTDRDQLDDKSINEYEKGYRYATNKDKLDQALENAVLKSGLYGDPVALNQYRYYGGIADEKKRRRRDAQKVRYDRMKRETELSPEELLAILTVWENERQRSPNHKSWQKLDVQDFDRNTQDNYFDQDPDETWMDGPVYPHVSHNPSSSNFYYEKPQIFEKHNQWNSGLDEAKKKRFMVAKKRSDPTRELRYLNGPTVNDYYTLSSLLNNQREPNVPVYHRRVL